jgi:hypothetical protein
MRSGAVFDAAGASSGAAFAAAADASTGVDRVGAPLAPTVLFLASVEAGGARPSLAAEGNFFAGSAGLAFAAAALTSLNLPLDEIVGAVEER